MWWTNSLCTLADEDLGTLAEYDPLTYVVQCYSAVQTFGYVSRGPHRGK